MVEYLIGVVVLLGLVLIAGGFAAAIAIDVLNGQLRASKRLAEERRKELELIKRRISRIVV